MNTTNFEMNDGDDFDRLSEILSRLVDSSLSDNDFADLVNILEGSAQAQEFYVRYLSLHDDLQQAWGPAQSEKSGRFIEQVQGMVSDSSQGAGEHCALFPKAGPGQSGWLASSTSWIIGLLSMIAILAFANLYMSFRENQAGANNMPVEPQRSPQLVAMTACVWSESKLAVGEVFDSGETLELLEGIAELEVATSHGTATAKIEGPASVYIRPDGGLELRWGVLTARVSSSVASVTIFTPECVLQVQGDSAAGIAVGAKSEVHVFDGSVTVKSFWASESKTETDESVLLDGEAAFVLDGDSGVEISKFEASESQFASARSMSFDRLNLTEDYKQVVLESNPAVYWRFESENCQNQALTDQESDADDQAALGNDATVVGSVVTRRFGEHVAAEFGLSPVLGYFVGTDTWPPEPLESFAIELWIKPSHFHGGALVSLVQPERVANRVLHGMFVEIGGPYQAGPHLAPANGFRFVHRNPPSSDYRTGASCKSAQAYKVREWQHIVANKTRDSLELYVDGVLVAATPDKKLLSQDLKIVVGQLWPQKTQKAEKFDRYLMGDKIRPFIGQLDELAIYERALKPDEIRKHVLAGRKANNKQNNLEDKAQF